MEFKQYVIAEIVSNTEKKKKYTKVSVYLCFRDDFLIFLCPVDTKCKNAIDNFVLTCESKLLTKVRC